MAFVLMVPPTVNTLSTWLPFSHYLGLNSCLLVKENFSDLTWNNLSCYSYSLSKLPCYIFFIALPELYLPYLLFFFLYLYISVLGCTLPVGDSHPRIPSSFNLSLLTLEVLPHPRGMACSNWFSGCYTWLILKGEHCIAWEGFRFHRLFFFF